ncbi:hypothetical protein ILYODFUR_038920 [Ilyodon furcidens]|uniref:Uncharacterized protein n=1 Tax=Ilyodon furcidens TaxID=33524 RepID=A0ABV0THQ4_9TELE
MSPPSAQQPHAVGLCVFVSVILKKLKVLGYRGCVLYVCSVLSPVCWWHPDMDLYDVSGSRCHPCVRSSRCGQKTHGLGKEIAAKQLLWHCDAGSKLQCGFLHFRISSSFVVMPFFLLCLKRSSLLLLKGC